MIYKIESINEGTKSKYLVFNHINAPFAENSITTFCSKFGSIDQTKDRAI